MCAAISRAGRKAGGVTAFASCRRIEMLMAHSVDAVRLSDDRIATRINGRSGNGVWWPTTQKADPIPALEPCRTKKSPGLSWPSPEQLPIYLASDREDKIRFCAFDHFSGERTFRRIEHHPGDIVCGRVVTKCVLAADLLARMPPIPVKVGRHKQHVHMCTYP